MNNDSQQIARIQHRIDTLRKAVNQGLDELQSQLDAMGGGDERTAPGEWRRDLQRLLEPDR